jgi:hypothetical protein
MLRRLAIALAAAVSLGVAAIPIAGMGRCMAGRWSWRERRRHFGARPPAADTAQRSPAFARGMPGGNAFVNRGVAGQPFVSGVVGNPLVGRSVLYHPFSCNVLAPPRLSAVMFRG